MTKDHRTFFSSKVFLRLRTWFRRTFSESNFVSRALICWAFASLLLKLDAVENYDARFKIRGNQKQTSEIVLVTVNPNEFAQMSKIMSSEKNMTSLFSLNELNNIADSFFWDAQIWTDLLTIILNQKPKVVGVTFYFGNATNLSRLAKKDLELFKNPHVIWAASSIVADKASLPFASLHNKSNIGSIDQMRDDDSVVRRIISDPELVTNFAEKLSQRNPTESRKITVINYRGQGSFDSIPLKAIISGNVPPNYFTNKIVVIGSEKSNTQQVLTPLGQMARHEFWAQATDNYLKGNFIKKFPNVIYVACLFFLMLVAVFIITHYPQAVSFFFFIWLATLWTAFSIWIFDTFAIWLPVASAYALLVLIWIMYIGYQALRIEKAHYLLQKEQRYFAELEQLKNNFVSLISHDLKTPIAKIHAVVDRLNLQEGVPEKLRHDYANLKDYSEELNRYIQSILKLLRVESKEFKINKEAGDLNGVIENVMARLQPLARAKNINMTLELEPMFLIEFDVTLITEVVLNLVENAIKYTPPNGAILVHTTEADSDVLIEVHDTGEGISSEDMDHIWRKFSRGKNQDLKTKGSGLGLYLAKYFIELHRGKISVKSELGKGSSFYIRLPID